jgi:hypothetical protein
MKSIRSKTETKVISIMIVFCFGLLLQIYTPQWTTKILGIPSTYYLLAFIYLYLVLSIKCSVTKEGIPTYIVEINIMIVFCLGLLLQIYTPQWTTRFLGISLIPYILLFIFIYLVFYGKFSMSKGFIFLSLLIIINLLVNWELHASLMTGARYLLYYSLYLFISKASEKNIRILYILLATIGTINFFITSYEVIQGENIFGMSSNNAHGARYFFSATRARMSFGDTIAFGVFQFLCLYSATKLKTYLKYFVMFLITISILYTQSYTSLLSAIVYLFRRHLHYLGLLVILSVMFFSNNFSVGSIPVRINNFIEALKGIASWDIDKLLFGHGLGLSRYTGLTGAIDYELPDYNDFTYYLMIVHEMGIIGLVGFLFVFVCFILKYTTSWDQLVLLLLIATSILSFEYFAYFWIFAILFGFVRNERTLSGQRSLGNLLFFRISGRNKISRIFQG